jgi:hypothetical protein
MALITTTTTGWKRPAAPDRHAPNRPVAPPLCRFATRRPASTGRIHPAPVAATTTI